MMNNLYFRTIRCGLWAIFKWSNLKEFAVLFSRLALAVCIGFLQTRLKPIISFEKVFEITFPVKDEQSLLLWKLTYFNSKVTNIYFSKIKKKEKQYN